MPDGPFDLILCRNLAFTYFDAAIQATILDGLSRRLCPGGFLVIGSHENLPVDGRAFETWVHGLPIYRRIVPGCSEAPSTASVPSI